MTILSSGPTTSLVPAAPAEPSSPTADLVTFTVDGIETAVPKGTLVIRAAEQLGIQIPRFCDHPLLAPAGACRQCLVEVWAPGRDGNAGQDAQAAGLLHPRGHAGHAGQDAAHVARGRQGPARRHGAAAHQPPARLPGVRQGRRVPAAEPGDEQRPRRAPGSSTSSARSRSRSRSRRRSCSTASAASCASAAPGSPRRSRATSFIDLQKRGAQPADRHVRHRRARLRRASAPLGAAEDTSRRPFASYFSGNTVQICPVGALTSAGVPVPVAARSTWCRRPASPSTTPAARRSASTTAAASCCAGSPATTRRSTRSGSRDKDRFAFTWQSAPTASPRRSCATRTASSSRPPGSRRSTPPRPACARSAGDAAVGVAARRSADARGRVRLPQVRPRRARHQRRRRPRPRRNRRGGAFLGHHVAGAAGSR